MRPCENHESEDLHAKGYEWQRLPSILESQCLMLPGHPFVWVAHFWNQFADVES